VRPEGGRIPVSTIGRPVDPSYPTNLAILVLSFLTLIAGLVTCLLQGEAFGASLVGGLQWAGSVFLAWVLAREADPDRWYSAFLAAAGGLASTVLLGPPGFVLLLWFVLGLRSISRTPGASPGVLDVVGLYGITLWLGFTVHWIVALLAMPVIFFIDLCRFPKALRVGAALALPAAAIVLGIARGGQIALPEWGWVEIVLPTAIAAMVVPVIVGYRRVRSVGDRTGEPLKPRRVQWAIAWAVAVALILTLIGSASTQELAPIWAALAGTALGWTAAKLLRQAKPSNPVQ